eukprot:TRINITY_DN3122_c0_g2_i2.p1 TRINITY_DN3122_c0_g2~~TRINITY_DN3122_c0_g2_i2.p1  ORF type:complete len:197 (+),score=77.96 TRINITY_DN3122_c0_g2_i2:125-715(+)
MREKLTSFGVERVRNVPLAHFLMWKYNLKASEVANAPQGANQEELAQALEMLAKVQAALKQVEAAEAAAKKREAEALESERPFRLAQEELQAAIDDLHSQEQAYKNKTLRRAKITTEAAERKAEKLRAPFKETRERAEEARAAAERAVEEARERMDEAEAYLAEVKRKPGQPYGALWWIDRELAEVRRYLPSSKRK